LDSAPLQSRLGLVRSLTVAALFTLPYSRGSVWSASVSAQVWFFDLMDSRVDAQPTVYIETMGCQMNVLDSELVLGQLRARNYRAVDSPVGADVVLINTCSVRDHAEQKALSRLGVSKKPKQRNPDMVVGVIGCMAERDPEGILAQAPYVDLICGPGELNKIPAMIDEVRATRQKTVALTQDKKRKSTLLERTLEYDSVEAWTCRATRHRAFLRSSRIFAFSAGATSSVPFASCPTRAARSVAAPPGRSWTKPACWSIAGPARSPCSVRR
jgi:tRNA-2-methylthio-N6-dimethylallyladenosine synthase